MGIFHGISLIRREKWLRGRRDRLVNTFVSSFLLILLGQIWWACKANSSRETRFYWILLPVRWTEFHWLRWQNHRKFRSSWYLEFLHFDIFSSRLTPFAFCNYLLLPIFFIWNNTPTEFSSRTVFFCRSSILIFPPFLTNTSKFPRSTPARI